MLRVNDDRTRVYVCFSTAPRIPLRRLGILQASRWHDIGGGSLPSIFDYRRLLLLVIASLFHGVLFSIPTWKLAAGSLLGGGPVRFSPPVMLLRWSSSVSCLSPPPPPPLQIHVHAHTRTTTHAQNTDGEIGIKDKNYATTTILNELERGKKIIACRLMFSVDVGHN